MLYGTISVGFWDVRLVLSFLFQSVGLMLFLMLRCFYGVFYGGFSLETFIFVVFPGSYHCGFGLRSVGYSWVVFCFFIGGFDSFIYLKSKKMGWF